MCMGFGLRPHPPTNFTNLLWARSTSETDLITINIPRPVSYYHIYPGRYHITIYSPVGIILPYIPLAGIIILYTPWPVSLHHIHPGRYHYTIYNLAGSIILYTPLLVSLYHIHLGRSHYTIYTWLVTLYHMHIHTCQVGKIQKSEIYK